MDIVKILRNLREFKLILEKIYKNPSLEFELYHHDEYLIDL